MLRNEKLSWCRDYVYTGILQDSGRPKGLQGKELRIDTSRQWISEWVKFTRLDKWFLCWYWPISKLFPSVYLYVNILQGFLWQCFWVCLLLANKFTLLQPKCVQLWFNHFNAECRYSTLVECLSVHMHVWLLIIVIQVIQLRSSL